MLMTVVHNVRLVLPDRVVEQGHLVIDDDVIVDIREATVAPNGADRIDGHGALCVPGLVDTHSDGLEKERTPRRQVKLPLEFSITSFEARVRSVGVTTMYHGIGYQENDRNERTVASARESVSALRDRRDHPSVAIDHGVLYRFEARDPAALDPLFEDLDSDAAGGMALVSFEDHTPGQGQYSDPEQFVNAIDPSSLPEGVTPRMHVERLMAEAEELYATRERNLERLAPRARAGEIRLLAHDPDGPEAVAIAHDAGAAVAEFPVNLEAARAARERGMPIVMGAPNALRGGSHNGNTSARDLVAAGLCDVLASDYLPPALLGAVFEMVAAGVCDLPTGIALVTSGPADLAGLDDRGRLEVGMRADLALVDDRGRWPTVVGTRRSGSGDRPAWR